MAPMSGGSAKGKSGVIRNTRQHSAYSFRLAGIYGLFGLLCRGNQVRNRHCKPLSFPHTLTVTMRPIASDLRDALTQIGFGNLYVLDSQALGGLRVLPASTGAYR